MLREDASWVPLVLTDLRQGDSATEPEPRVAAGAFRTQGRGLEGARANRRLGRARWPSELIASHRSTAPAVRDAEKGLPDVGYTHSGTPKCEEVRRGWRRNCSSRTAREDGADRVAPPKRREAKTSTIRRASAFVAGSGKRPWSAPLAAAREPRRRHRAPHPSRPRPSSLGRVVSTGLGTAATSLINCPRQGGSGHVSRRRPRRAAAAESAGCPMKRL